MPKPLQNSESMRDTFGHLLFMIAYEANIDMDAVFSLTLTVNYLSIAQCDGIP